MEERCEFCFMSHLLLQKEPLVTIPLQCVAFVAFVVKESKSVQRVDKLVLLSGPQPPAMFALNSTSDTAEDC